MGESFVSVSAEDLDVPAWDEAVRRVERGETIAVLAHDEHVADVVPSGQVDRLRETIGVLADTDAVRALADAETVVVGREAIRALVVDRDR